MEYGLKSQTSACGAYDGLPATQPHRRLTTTLLGQLFRTIPKLTEHSKSVACCIALLVADADLLQFILEGWTEQLRSPDFWRPVHRIAQNNTTD